MSGRRRRHTGGVPADSADTREVAVAGLALATLALVAVTLLSTPALAQDSSPPTFGNGTAVNDTTLEVMVEDDTGVDEGSINQTDLSLSTGSIDSIDVEESGNDSAVYISLEDRVRSQNVTVSLADGGTIADDAGNELTDGSVTVTGVDGYTPYLQEYGVSWVNDSTVEIAFYVDERLDNISVAVHGPESTVLGPEDFTETDTPPAIEFRYDTNYTFRAEGEYRITLELVADPSGNRGLYFADRTVVHDVTSPQARMSSPASTTLGQTVAFDASESTDNQGVQAYEWRIDGNVTGTNETFEHAFDDSGSHEVALTVTDERGNTDTAVRSIEVLDVSTTRDVTIAPRNGTGVDVVIGPNRTKRRVLVDRSGSLARNDSISLDSLTLNVPTNATANLTTAADGDAPTDFAVPDQTGFGTFDVEREGAEVSDVTFRFTVNRTALENASVPADGMSLYRDSGEGWSRLPALRVGGNDTHLQYRATSSGFSRFVVAGSNTTGDTGSDADDPAAPNDGSPSEESGGEEVNGGEPAVAIVDARLLTHDVSSGDPVVARATVVNDGNGTGTGVVGLEVDGSVVGTGAVTVPPGAQREVTVATPIETGGLVTMNGSRLGSVTVGGGAVASGSDGGFSIPNPLSLWPGGLFGRVLGAMFWLVVVVYAILKSLAIYLGY